MRLLLTIAYDGGPYAGWQSQAAGDAVQDFVEGAFRRIAPGRVAVHGAGRTDAGVHALGQCAHADVPGGMSPGNWQRALNANLPPSIRVVGLREVPQEFHARFLCEREGLSISHSQQDRSAAARIWPCLAPASGARSRSTSAGGKRIHRAPRFRRILRQSGKSGSRYGEDSATDCPFKPVGPRKGDVRRRRLSLQDGANVDGCNGTRCAAARGSWRSAGAPRAGRPEMESCCPRRRALSREGSLLTGSQITKIVAKTRRPREDSRRVGPLIRGSLVRRAGRRLDFHRQSVIADLEI